MPEPTHDPLSPFDPEVPMTLSGADIRRRGDRLRRRNTGLAIAGGVTVIALIVAPIAVLTGGDDRAVDPAEPVPTVTDPTPVDPTGIDPTGPDDPAPGSQPLVTTIPDGFPLAAGYPDTNEDLTPVMVVDDARPTDFDLCLGDGFDPATTALTDAASVSYSAPEDSRVRLLTVWEDEPSAAAALRTARDTLAACDGDGFVTTERETSYDTEAVAFTRQAGPEVNPSALGLDVYELVRVRNALYLSYDYGEGGGTPEAAEAGVAAAFEASAEVVAAAYDVFGADVAPAAPDDLTSFPLALGWPDPADVEPGPEFGLEGPSNAVEPIDYEVCGRTLEVPETTGDLRARYSNVEDFRTRRLLTFVTADDAVAFVESARAFNEACTEDPSEIDDTARLTETLDSNQGGQSFAVFTSTQMFGEPAIGLWVSQFVRLGRAVLVDTTYGEGFRSSAPGVLETMTADSADVVAAMCTFTEAGC